MMWKRFFVLVFVVSLGLLAACGGGEEAGVAATAVSSAPIVEVTAQLPTAVPAVAEAAPVDMPLTTLPRAFSYAGVDFVISDGRLTNRSLIDPNTAVADTFRVELTVQGQNNSGFKADIVNGVVQIDFADGTAVAQTVVDPIEIGETRSFAVSGAVQPNTTWDGATLTLSEAGKEPLTIALTGPETVTGQSQPLAGGEATGLNKYDESIQYQITEASLWLDGPQSGGYYVHAPAGQQFLRITAHVTNTGGSSGVSIYAEQFQAVADGTSSAVSYDVNGAQSVTLNASTDVSFYFLVPANAANLAITVAADGTQPATILLVP